MDNSEGQGWDLDSGLSSPHHLAWAPNPLVMGRLASQRPATSEAVLPSSLPLMLAGRWPELSFQHQAEQPSAPERWPGRS